MPCKSCLVLELEFEILLEGAHNTSVLPMILEHFQRNGWRIRVEGLHMTIAESSVRDFIDFSQDYMKVEEMAFRVKDTSLWQPFANIVQVLDMQWLDDVIRQNRVVSYSQPIVDRNGDIAAYEVLSRFTREDGSLIYPHEIFTAAKSRGRLYALDRLCRMAAVRYSAMLYKKTFINFIPTSIYSPEFCLQSTVKLARQLQIDPNQFVFEVVESEHVDDIEHLKSILHYYDEKGFQYALDDVGEGYSTLELLLDLKPHYMKLDMKYVQGVHHDADKQQVATLFLQKARDINAVPLAEGIEDAADFEWLKEQGYELFQGYLFGKPSIEPQRSVVYARG